MTPQQYESLYKILNMKAPQLSPNFIFLSFQTTKNNLATWNIDMSVIFPSKKYTLKGYTLGS